MKRIEKVEMLLGKGILCTLGIAIVLGLFVASCYVLSFIINIMLHNLWFTIIFVIIDFIIIFRELKKD